MNLVFATNARFEKGPDNNIYGVNTSIKRSTFDHYLKVFEKVFVLARVDEAAKIIPKDTKPVNDERVNFLPLPYFIGPWQYLKIKSLYHRTLEEHLSKPVALISRVPGLTGRLAAELYYRKGWPYAVEVAGDPWDLFSKQASDHPLRLFLRWQGYKSLQKTVKNASAALYVTKSYLQHRYPVSAGIYNTYASNVIVDSSLIPKTPRTLRKGGHFNALTVGTLDQLYKSPFETIDIINQINLTNTKIKISHTWLGGGKHLERLRKKVIEKNLQDTFHFIGKIGQRSKMYDQYKKADFFILLSRTEGLPRAVIEAMSFGLPVVATNAGGIKELLNEEVIFEWTQMDELKNKISEILSNETYYQTLSKTNLIKSFEYTQEKLNERRFQFYDAVKSTTLKRTNK